jgi:hypothetical protein
MRRSVTLRELLALTLVVGVLLPLAIGAATWFGVRHWQQDRRSGHVAAATKLIEDGAGRFDSPAWRRAARDRLDSLGIGAQVAFADEHRKGIVFAARFDASAASLKSPTSSQKTLALGLPQATSGSCSYPR